MNTASPRDLRLPATFKIERHNHQRRHSPLIQWSQPSTAALSLGLGAIAPICVRTNPLSGLKKESLWTAIAPNSLASLCWHKVRDLQQLFLDEYDAMEACNFDGSDQY